MSKLILISAPSGTGKSTLINRLMQQAPDLRLRFSVSATSRAPRGEEQHGVEYYFLSDDDFRQRIRQGEFIEYEEVYNGTLYGTLRSEVDRIASEGSNVLFDVDAVGALNIKRQYGASALAVFVLPPSVAHLRQRLEGRHTDPPDVIETRLAKAEIEMQQAPLFDLTLTNDDLQDCTNQLEAAIRKFLQQPKPC